MHNSSSQLRIYRGLRWNGLTHSKYIAINSKPTENYKNIYKTNIFIKRSYSKESIHISQYLLYGIKPFENRLLIKS